MNVAVSCCVPQVAETGKAPRGASGRTVAVPNRCHGWWPFGSGCSAATSSTGERTAPRSSRHATSSFTVAFRKPSCGDSRSQLPPEVGAGVVAGTGDVVVRLGVDLTSVRLAAPAHAAASIPTLAMLTLATTIRTLMSRPACHPPASGTLSHANPASVCEKWRAQRSMLATGARRGEPSSSW